MEGSKLQSEERVVEDNDHKHLRIQIRRLRARRVNLAPRVKPKKSSSTSTTKKDQRLVITAFPCHEVFMFLNQHFLGALQCCSCIQSPPKASKWPLCYDPQTPPDCRRITFFSIPFVHLPTMPPFLVSLRHRVIYTTNAGSSLLAGVKGGNKT
ncbi:unnamed protein product [Sphenostylis stenocarpa]|uniref:Uncharacterized protein n=1 Tax=Sphenostylis stenocarpa TaxID=92480 RepID=A0AA86SA31_9FABA|nr:unnamed protein product [Sphenostylis stenocarpa]